MTRLEIIQDFFKRWPAVSLSNFASDINIHRTTLARVLHEHKEPGDASWPKIATGLAKYGYPTRHIKGEKTAIATVGGYRQVTKRLETHRTADIRYEFINVPIWKPDQVITPQRPMVIGWEDGPPIKKDELLQMLLEQLEMDIAEGYEPDMLITSNLEEGADFDGKVVYLKPK